MNRLFNTIRRIVEKPRVAETVEAEPVPGMEGFENRVEVLYTYAQRAAEYEDDLTAHFEQIRANLERVNARIEQALDEGRDGDAFEFVRLAARLRPQYDLLDFELRAFSSVASELILRVNTLMDNLEEARAYAQDGEANPTATAALDLALTRLTRYFVMLERVATTRRRALPERLAEHMLRILDDRQLDLELAGYILARRRQLRAGNEQG